MKRNKTMIPILAILLAVGAGTIAASAREDDRTNTVPAAQVEQGQPAAPDELLAPVGSGFTYQGSLKDGGNPANGQYDFTFKLFDSLSGGVQVGSTLTVINQTVSQGLFTVQLDFGSTAFRGDARWLEIAVRPTGGGAYTTLSPRQPLSATPYAASLMPGAAVVGTSGTPLAMLTVANTRDTGYAVYGTASGLNGSGVYGFATNGLLAAGVRGSSPTGMGVHGQAVADATSGVFGETSGNNGAGVRGEAHANTGSRGVWGQSDPGSGVFGESSTGAGVYGLSGSGPGVYGISNSHSGVVGSSASSIGISGSSTTNVGVRGASTGGYGVDGQSTNSTGVNGASNTHIGVQGSANAANKAGVFGLHTGTGYGVYGTGTTGIYGTTESSTGYGVHGVANGTDAKAVAGYSTDGIGVYGTSTTDWAGYFAGNVNVTGTCCASGELTTQIDHPLDPENKYLVQAAVQSPDLKSVYDGNVTTDARGEAVVTLPGYVEALNTDFRYQLTIVGDRFAQARVSSKVKNNRFTIKTNQPNVEVSWQVTGIRKDPYAKAHPVEADVEKPAGEQGRYQHPSEWGRPESKGIGYEERQRMGEQVPASAMSKPAADK